MNINQIMAVVYAGMAIQVATATPTVSDVVARQRYPWNGMVDIDYTITGDASGLKLEIGVEDRQGGKSYTPTKFLSVLPISVGRHRVTWSTEAEGVSIISTNVAVTVSLVQVDPAYQKKNLYYVVDLSGGPTATSFPVTTLEAPPDTEWSNEYKTTKLVLRRIEAGEDPLKRYTITKPFYIGVFEVTMAQWELVMSTSANPTTTDARAKYSVSYSNIRGEGLGVGWPNSSDVDGTSFLGVLRNKTGMAFDLPTEAQGEYACRAGTTSSYNNGGKNVADLETLGHYWGNSNDGRGGHAGVTTVGSYMPNAWGLYVMHGNVYEFFLDWFSYDGELLGEDPIGPQSGSYNVLRGGGYRRDGDNFTNPAGICTSSFRERGYPQSDRLDGFRISCSAAR